MYVLANVAAVLERRNSVDDVTEEDWDYQHDTPPGYVAEPDELAGTVVFLASQHAGYITGATINASGGLLM